RLELQQPRGAPAGRGGELALADHTALDELGGDGGDGGDAQPGVARQLRPRGGGPRAQRQQHRQAVMFADVVVLYGSERHEPGLSKGVYKAPSLSYALRRGGG